MLASGAMPPDAIRYAISQLGDGHSFYVEAKRAESLIENAEVTGFDIQHSHDASIAYLKIPPFAGNMESRVSAFAGELRNAIQELERERPCGWLVDLRANSGGNMGPMLSGLRPLLGEGLLFRYVGRHESTEVTSQTIDQHMGKLELPEVRVRDAPVALLVGSGTKSAGEAVFVSFIGRPRTRSFGEPSGGQSSGNRGVWLSDHSLILVMTALIADRGGRVYGGPVTPDEIISPAKARAQAEEWLKASCGA